MLTIFKQDEDEIIIENVSDKIVNYICSSCPDVVVSVTESEPHKAQIKTVSFTMDYVIHYNDHKILILSTRHKKRLSVVI